MSDYRWIREQIDSGSRPRGEIWSAVDRAARKGCPEAQFTLGYRWYRQHGPYYRKARDWLAKAAQAGHPEGQNLLASIDELLQQQRRRLRQLASQGEAEAQRDWGCLLATGCDGLGSDLVEARYWYLQAALQGHQDAQFNVATMLLLGEGGEVCREEALEWLRRALVGPDGVTVEMATKLLLYQGEGG